MIKLFKYFEFKAIQWDGTNIEQIRDFISSVYHSPEFEPVIVEVCINSDNDLHIVTGKKDEQGDWRIMYDNDIIELNLWITNDEQYAHHINYYSDEQIKKEFLTLNEIKNAIK